tara:strand:- start:287 stop:529 length:243 start_codon:yes stop_codon:yes gene_type:complete
MEPIMTRLEYIDHCAMFYCKYELPEDWWIMSDKHLYAWCKKNKMDSCAEENGECIWWHILIMARSWNKTFNLGFDLEGIR